MDITDIIRTRRSVYPEQFSEEIIKEKELMLLLENANYAPTHKLTQPWRFRIISGGKKEELGLILAENMKANTALEQFSEMTYRKMISRPVKSSHVIAICLQRDPKESLPEWEELAALSMAVQNIWLSGTAMGIGMYWATPKPLSSKEVAEFLSLGAGEKCYGFLYMGYYTANPDQKANRKPMEEKLMWIG
jgi:nitroreductase